MSNTGRESLTVLYSKTHKVKYLTSSSLLLCVTNHHLSTSTTSVVAKVNFLVPKRNNLSYITKERHHSKTKRN